MLIRRLWILHIASKCKFGFHFAADGANPFFSPGGFSLEFTRTNPIENKKRAIKTRRCGAATSSANSAFFVRGGAAAAGLKTPP